MEESQVILHFNLCESAHFFDSLSFPLMQQFISNLQAQLRPMSIPSPNLLPPNRKTLDLLKMLILNNMLVEQYPDQWLPLLNLLYPDEKKSVSLGPVLIDLFAPHWHFNPGEHEADGPDATYSVSSPFTETFEIMLPGIAAALNLIQGGDAVTHTNTKKTAILSWVFQLREFLIQASDLKQPVASTLPSPAIYPLSIAAVFETDVTNLKQTFLNCLDFITHKTTEKWPDLARELFMTADHVAKKSISELQTEQEWQFEMMMSAVDGGVFSLNEE